MKRKRVRSNPLSKLLRPVFEKSRYLVMLMLLVNTSLMTAGVVIPPTHAFDYAHVQELPELREAEITEVATGSTFQFPVLAPADISQNYHALHRGIDVRAPKGTPIVAVAQGVVIEVREQVFGYGKHVRIAHNGTVASLYAHLDEIEVKVGQRVEKGDEIGTVGTTGWVTGPHLHFELSEAQGTMNPKNYVGN